MVGFQLLVDLLSVVTRMQITFPTVHSVTSDFKFKKSYGFAKGTIGIPLVDSKFDDGSGG
jgi:hypothetical protein